MQVGLKTENVSIIPFAGFVWLCYQYFGKRNTFFTLNLSSVCSSLPMDDRKMSAHDITNTCAILTGLVH